MVAGSTTVNDTNRGRGVVHGARSVGPQHRLSMAVRVGDGLGHRAPSGRETVPSCPACRDSDPIKWEGRSTRPATVHLLPSSSLFVSAQQPTCAGVPGAARPQHKMTAGSTAPGLTRVFTQPATRGDARASPTPPVRQSVVRHLGYTSSLPSRARKGLITLAMTSADPLTCLSVRAHAPDRVVGFLRASATRWLAHDKRVLSRGWRSWSCRRRHGVDGSLGVMDGTGGSDRVPRRGRWRAGCAGGAWFSRRSGRTARCAGWPRSAPTSPCLPPRPTCPASGCSDWASPSPQPRPPPPRGSPTWGRSSVLARGALRQRCLRAAPLLPRWPVSGWFVANRALRLLGEEGFGSVGAVAVLVGALFGCAGQHAKVSELVAVLGA